MWVLLHFFGSNSCDFGVVLIFCIGLCNSICTFDLYGQVVTYFWPCQRFVLVWNAVYHSLGFRSSSRYRHMNANGLKFRCITGKLRHLLLPANAILSPALSYFRSLQSRDDVDKITSSVHTASGSTWCGNDMTSLGASLTLSTTL